MKIGFCGLVAYDLKPYGPAFGTALPELLASTHLDCDNYMALAWHLFKIMVPSPTITVMAVGVDHGPVGNHGFLATNKKPDANGNGGGYWIIDPTVGLVNCGHGIDWVLSGRPVNMNYTKSFYWRSDIDSFNAPVKAALQNGLHRPTHLLYFTRSFDKFMSPAPVENWMTPSSELP